MDVGKNMDNNLGPKNTATTNKLFFLAGFRNKKVSGRKVDLGNWYIEFFLFVKFILVSFLKFNRILLEFMVKEINKNRK